MEIQSRIENLSLQGEIVVALSRLSRAIHPQSRVLMQDRGRTLPNWPHWRAIARLHPFTASAIAKHVHLGQSTLTAILNPLEKRIRIHLRQRFSKLKEWKRTQILFTRQRIADMMDATEIKTTPVLSRLGRHDSRGTRAAFEESTTLGSRRTTTISLRRGLPVRSRTSETTYSASASKVRG
jgi:hypothetical protein